MSRYRPPGEKSSPYITAQGFKALSDELDYLWRVKRPEVVAAITTAAAEGDRSENAEYIYRKKELRELDRRARYLAQRVDVVKVVDSIPDDTGRVFFGASVTVINEHGETRRHRVVGADETSVEKGWISIDSPVARALLGKRVGDVVLIRLPAGESELEITAIDYQTF